MHSWARGPPPEGAVGWQVQSAPGSTLKWSIWSSGIVWLPFVEVDMGTIERHIRTLGLNVNVAWIGSHLHQFIHERSQRRESSLFFNWTPNWVTAMGNYTRVKFPICQRDGLQQHCDFDIQQMSKMVWPTIQSHTPEAYELIKSMQYTEAQYEELLRYTPRYELLDSLRCFTVLLLTILNK